MSNTSGTRSAYFIPGKDGQNVKVHHRTKGNPCTFIDSEAESEISFHPKSARHQPSEIGSLKASLVDNGSFLESSESGTEYFIPGIGGEEINIH